MPRPERESVNQPKGYSGEKAVQKYKCVNHDYVFYPESWMDTETGKYFEKGCYDESGERYDVLIIDENGTSRATLECRYCGTISKESWAEGPAPTCVQCGANLIENSGRVIKDKMDNSTVAVTSNSGYGSTAGAPGKPGKKFGGVIVAVVVILTILGGIGSSSDSTSSNYGGSSYYSDYEDGNWEDTQHSDSIYVSEIDRTLPWVEDYESYYDSVTDCYVWYNSYAGEWQYWYEGISSDFGDYGWMEYDRQEKQWYIERNEGDWVVLPSKYDRSKLWYIKD